MSRCIMQKNLVFQFPPPRRGRPGGQEFILGDLDFNSRPRVGGDGKMSQIHLQHLPLIWHFYTNAYIFFLKNTIIIKKNV